MWRVLQIHHPQAPLVPQIGWPDLNPLEAPVLAEFYPAALTPAPLTTMWPTPDSSRCHTLHVLYREDP